MTSEAGSSVKSFLKSKTGAGAILILCLILAAVWRNCPYGASYETFWKLKSIFGFPIYFSLRGWFNDVWMSLFFLVVSLEIKFEFADGLFKDRKNAINPLIVSIASMAAPLGLCAAITYGTPAFRAWPIPLATDIALSLAMVGLGGSSLPQGSRPYMASIALIDDIGGIFLVALLFTSAFVSLWAAACVAAVIVLHQVFKRWSPPFWALAVGMAIIWLTFHLSGVPAALSGVVFALAVPGKKPEGGESTVKKCIDGLSGWVNFLIVPLFILANAGANFFSTGPTGFDWRLFLGISLGLFIAKPVSMFVFGLGSQKAGLGDLPAGTTVTALAGQSFIGGIGLKMCLYLTTLALPVSQHGIAILGIYAGLASSAIAAFVILRGPWAKPVTSAATA